MAIIKDKNKAATVMVTAFYLIASEQDLRSGRG